MGFLCSISTADKRAGSLVNIIGGEYKFSLETGHDTAAFKHCSASIMEQETEQDTAARYRVKKICIRRGWAIDQIKFEYDDEKTWSVGVDGGRKDNREFIMTPGEYITRVTHETLNQR